MIKRGFLPNISDVFVKRLLFIWMKAVTLIIMDIYDFLKNKNLATSQKICGKSKIKKMYFNFS